jgi:hypothetical protein
MSEMTPDRVARALACAVVFGDELPEHDAEQDEQGKEQDHRPGRARRCGYSRSTVICLVPGTQRELFPVRNRLRERITSWALPAEVAVANNTDPPPSISQPALTANPGLAAGAGAASMHPIAADATTTATRPLTRLLIIEPSPL